MCRPTVHKTLLGAIFISLMFIEFSNFVKGEKNDKNLLCENGYVINTLGYIFDFPLIYGEDAENKL